MNSTRPGVTRREMVLQLAPMVAIAAAGIVPAIAATTDRSQTDPGPRNPDLDAQNPDSAWPPTTDSKSLVQNFKYPFSFANKRAYEGGWSREVTVRELPISKSIAGVNMRLTAGGVRELHWHAAGEWAIILYGNARITAIDQDGKSFVADVKQNDLWYFPSGIPHSIQGLGPDGTEFMLVFDDGTFSEQETALLSDSMAHLPPEVLAKNFGVAEQAMNNLPKQELFIFQTEVPGSLEDDQKAAAGDLGKSPIDFAFRTMEMPPTKNTKGGEVRIVDSSKFKVSTTIAMAMVTVHPGGLRELHWHPNADEWQYYIAGKGRMTVVDMGNKGRTMDFQAGDVGYVEKSLLHWATSDTTGDLGLQDAWARYHIPHTPFALEAGQIRDPVDHEQIMFATKTLTPGRSIVNNVLLNGDDIVKGASISYGYDGDNPFRTELAFTSGERNFDTNFEDFPTNSANWGAAGRFEYKLFGDWNDYNQFTGLNNKQPLLVLGAGLDYTEAGAAGALTHVADVQYTLPNGLSLYGAYLGRYVRDNGGSPTTNGTLTSLGPTFDTYDASARVMAAYLIKEHWEPSQDSNGSISMAANCRPARTMSYMMPRWV